jgi:hypothetical protein
MTWVGGVAALITLVVLSIASARLNSIMRMIGEENSQLNFQRLAANEGVCSTLEGSLADSSIDKAFGLLSQLNAKDDEREIFKDLAVAMKSVDAENGGALMAKLPAPGSTTRLRVVSQSRNRLSDRHLEDFKMPPSLRADAISETPFLIQFSDPSLETAAGLYAARLIHHKTGAPSLCALKLSPEFLQFALRPEERSHFDPYRHFEEHAIFALSDAKGSLLLSTPKRK